MSPLALLPSRLGLPGNWPVPGKGQRAIWADLRCGGGKGSGGNAGAHNMKEHMTTHIERHGLPSLDEDEHAYCRQYLKGKDPEAVALDAGVSSKTLARAAAGLGLSSGSRTCLRLALRRWGFKR